MVAMMFPAATPVVVIFARWAQRRGPWKLATGIFVGGYIAVWGSVGLGAYAILAALEAWIPAPSPLATRVGAVLLVLAGAYQFTSVKDACLKHCRSPLQFLVHHANRMKEGHFGAFRVGLTHGAYCLGCCWPLMIILLLLGMMNLVWMGLVAALILAEKVLPSGRLLGRVAGRFASLIWPHPERRMIV
jgi:predicted metal-binding membrane protein